MTREGGYITALNTQAVGGWDVNEGSQVTPHSSGWIGLDWIGLDDG